jgi:CubicO group peptidase (beta-lactamase class C family)
VDLHGGYRDAQRKIPWTDDTLVLTWSATKGLGSACLLHVLQTHKIGLERPVAEFWPAFAQARKAGITLAQLLSHQAGLAVLDESVDVRDYDAVVRRWKSRKPIWLPGTAHGYHARTFGFLLDELVRRIDSRSIAKYWREIFAEPLGLDIWIGLPRRRTITLRQSIPRVYPLPRVRIHFFARSFSTGPFNGRRSPRRTDSIP